MSSGCHQDRSYCPYCHEQRLQQARPAGERVEMQCLTCRNTYPASPAQERDAASACLEIVAIVLARAEATAVASSTEDEDVVRTRFSAVVTSTKRAGYLLSSLRAHAMQVHA